MSKWFIAAILLITNAAASAAPLTFQSTNQQVSLLELYTSEGCSSCPPADRWISQLKSDPRLWREIIPVAFHVDYWDYIGWPDRFASAMFSQRQRQYAQTGNIRTVYTPGLVLDGNEWRGWFSDPVLRLAPRADVGSLRLDIENGQALISFTPLQAFPNQLTLHLALLGFDLSTAVKAGENRGRQLRHDFTVVAYQTAPIVQQGGRYSLQLPLPSHRFAVPRLAVAAWLSNQQNQRPLQAVGGWLPPI